MPNWCSNTLTITGSDKDLKAFRRKAKLTREVKSIEGKVSKRTTDFSFGAFDPMPEELEEVNIGFTTIGGQRFERWVNKPDGTQVGLGTGDLALLKKKYGYTNWNEWNNARIGCKWDVEGAIQLAQPGSLTYTFESPWGPPEIGVELLAQKYPSLKFTLEFDEPGMDFAGVRVYQGGQAIGEEDFDSKIADQIDEEDARQEQQEKRVAKREQLKEKQRLALESEQAAKDIAAGKKVRVPRAKVLD